MTVHWEILADPIIILRLILQIFLFALSALFSSSETALFSLRETDIQRLEATDKSKARRLRDLIDEPRQLIVSILCGNELINIAATINLAGILLLLLGDPTSAALVNTVVMLPLLLIFGEITPKTLAVTKPVWLSTRLIEPAMTLWVQIVTPLRIVVRWIAERITRAIVGEERAAKSTLLDRDEFRTLLTDVEAQGLVNASERKMILNLLEASHTDVTQIMEPRPRVNFISDDQTIPEMIEKFRVFRHRRVPVYHKHRDNVIGMLREETLVKLLAQKDVNDLTLDDILTPPFLVPETQQISHLAEHFKDDEHHAAMVVNEYGGIEGMVTSDDVFAFLTHGIASHVLSHTGLREDDDGSFWCHGLTPLHMVTRTIPLKIDDSADVSTLGGLIMMWLNRVPEPGDEIHESEYVFRVESMQGLLVDRVRITSENRQNTGKPEDAA